MWAVWGERMVRAMNLARLASLMLVAAPLAHAAEECALEAKVIRPQFAAKLPKGFKLVSTKKEKRNLTQVLKTPDNFEITLTFGGCAHIEYSVALKGGGLTTKTVGAELVATARRVLPTIPLEKDSTVDVKLFSKALEEANISTMPAHLPCGDATCTMSLEGEEAKPTKGKKPASKKPEPEKDPVGILKFSYDFPL
jgi:hypothetical protein